MAVLRNTRQVLLLEVSHRQREHMHPYLEVEGGAMWSDRPKEEGQDPC